MGLEIFSLARDFLYLAALFLGSGIGCILNHFRKKSTAHYKNLTITAGFCFFSGTVAALTAASIISNWTIFTETGLYLPLGIVTAIVILAFRFPRAVGFPSILIGGLMVVLIGYTCLRFPAVDESNGELRSGLNAPAGRGRVIRDANGLVHITLVSPSGIKSVPPIPLRSIENALEFKALCFSFPNGFPLMGGKKRGVIVEVLYNNESLYTDTGANNFTFFFPKPAVGSNRSHVNRGTMPPRDPVSSWEVRGILETKNLNPGAGLTVFLNGTNLAFR